MSRQERQAELVDEMLRHIWTNAQWVQIDTTYSRGHREQSLQASTFVDLLATIEDGGVNNDKTEKLLAQEHPLSSRTAESTAIKVRTPTDAATPSEPLHSEAATTEANGRKVTTPRSS